MGSPLSRRNQVDIGLGDQVAALGKPLNCPVHRLGLPLKVAGKGRFGNDRKINGRVGQIISYTVLVIPFGLFFFLFIEQGDS